MDELRGPVAQALDEYEQRLRDRGSRAVDQLRPGLSAGEIDRLQEAFGVRLSSSARRVWSWHDGMKGDGVPLVPYRTFPDLRSSLLKGQWIAAQVNPILDEPEMEHLRWNDQWVILTTDGQLSLVIDCSHGPNDDRTMLYVAGESVDSFVQLPLLHRIRWWSWAVDNGAWIVTEDGGWQVDASRYPVGPGLDNVLY